MSNFFFFSSRRRHTRCSRDWSSDVCSSDLAPGPVPELQALKRTLIEWAVEIESEARPLQSLRSEEGLALLAGVVEETPKLSAPPAAELLEQLAAAARGLLDQAREPSRLSRWKELAAARVPVFIYFEQ